MTKRTIATLAAAAALSAGAAQPAAAQNIEVGHIPTCLQAVPGAISGLSSGTIDLNVQVLLDGVPLARGQQIVDGIRATYTALNLNVVPAYASVSFTGTDAQGFIDQAKALYGGTRPAGIDVVYVLTSEDQTFNGDSGNAGLADCIGGVAFPERAFAAGEDTTTLFGGDINFLGMKIGGWSSKVMAHEIGHLFGGHHHYANCAEGFLDVTKGYISPCSLMFNDISLAGFNFSQVNGRVVRGHGVFYAQPAPPSSL